MATLKNEIAAYERMRNDLEVEHLGKWVVMHHEKLVGTYESFEAAAEDAVQNFGRGAVLDQASRCTAVGTACFRTVSTSPWRRLIADSPTVLGIPGEIC